jgi:hypothetical protein
LLGGDGGLEFRNPRLIGLLLAVDFLEGGGIIDDFKEKTSPPQ